MTTYRSLTLLTALAAAAILAAGCTAIGATRGSSAGGARTGTMADTVAEPSQQTSAEDGTTTGGPAHGATSAGATAADKTMAPSAEVPAEPVAVDGPADAGSLVVGYFTDWGIYDRGYLVRDIETSGSADHLTHILYAFGNVDGGRCKVGDAWADHDKAFTAAESVDGVADGEAGLAGDHGNFAQLKKLKAMHPGLKVLWSFGGWTWSSGFPQAAVDAEAFAESCYRLVHDPRWDGLFDGIDIDWEYPNECGLSCDETSGREGYSTLIKALRARFGPDETITSAIGAGIGKLDAADYAGAAPSVDFFLPMTYDYFGPWDPKGPTAPHSPLTSWDTQPKEGADAQHSIDHLLGMGVPANKLLLGLGFYGHGWMGVTDPRPGGKAAGVARGTYESGTDDYQVLMQKCPATGEIAGTAYGLCDGEWWGYDTPATMQAKMAFVKEKGLAGAFFWELSGDTPDGELIRAIAAGLR